MVMIEGILTDMKNIDIETCKYKTLEWEFDVGKCPSSFALHLVILSGGQGSDLLEGRLFCSFICMFAYKKESWLGWLNLVVTREKEQGTRDKGERDPEVTILR